MTKISTHPEVRWRPSPSLLKREGEHRRCGGVSMEKERGKMSTPRLNEYLKNKNMTTMRKIGISFVALALIASACNTTKEQKKDMSNPFFNEYKTPFQVPPFDEIKLEHFMPAVEEGIDEQVAEIKAITDSKDEATFDNTILAFDQSGDLLTKASNVFFNQNSANTNDEMQALAREITPKLSTHRDHIMLNKDVFVRVTAG
jgi:peptidyl-dipeptidase Dcp